MQSNILWYVISVLVLVYSGSALTPWTVATLPNPYTSNTTANATVGFVSNPDSVLTSNEVDYVNAAVDNVIVRTNCVCDRDCPVGTSGFVISVVVVNMTLLNATLNMNMTGTAAQIQQSLAAMAEQIRARWNIGTCQNDALLFVAGDKQFTVALASGVQTQMYLQDYCLRAIFANYHITLASLPSDIVSIVTDLGITLSTVRCAVRLVGDEVYTFVDTYNTGEIATIIIGSVLCGVFVISCGIALFCCERKTRLQQKAQAKKAAKLARNDSMSVKKPIPQIVQYAATPAPVSSAPAPTSGAASGKDTAQNSSAIVESTNF